MQQSPYYKNRYRSLGGAIWTNRAIDLIIERGADQDMLAQAIRHPDTIQNGRTEGFMEYKKHIKGYNITLIMKRGDKGELLVLSWMSSPPIGSRPQEKNNNDPWIIRFLKGLKYIMGF